MQERTSALDRYKKAKKKIEEAQKICQQEMKLAFDQGAAVLFNKYPRLKSFSWEQHTPYFNDGDPCTFNAMTEEPRVIMAGMNEMDADIDLDGVTDQNDPDAELQESVMESVCEFLTQFSLDDYCEVFGDDCEVVVTSNGTSTNNVEHD